MAPRIILVTGAGGGIGRALVKRLRARGDEVIASARRLEQIADLADAGAKTVAIDVGENESVHNGFRQIGALFGDRIDATVHCAAAAPVGTVEFTPPDAVAALFNVNTLGALRILQASLPRIRNMGGGRFIFVSSLWGRVSGPFVSTYAASKHAVEALADSVRREIRGQNIFVSIVEPGVVKTDMFTNQLANLRKKSAALQGDELSIYGRMYGAHAKLLSNAERTAIAAEKCAQVIEDCLDSRRPRTRYKVGMDAKMLLALDRLSPDRALDAIFGFMYKG